ncbi:MAG TPA: phospholipid carrier-dependent glycosyltransferase [Phototrophicaceae bacterium]|nr:phospholipid carrier-dependent glycosyltransferase [Phototrophicaceae bacterium]
MDKRRLIWPILIVALALRLIVALSQDPLAPYSNGNDSSWYLLNAYALIVGHAPEVTVPVLERWSPYGLLHPALAITGHVVTVKTDVSNLASPPFYFILIGVPRVLFAPATAVILVRVLQAIFSAATCYFAYRLTIRLTNRASAGLLAATVLAISPAFVIESAQILTETTYIFFMVCGIWLYVESILSEQRQRILPLLALAAILFGLAALTRAVLLAFPLGIAIHLIMVRGWRKGWRQAFFLLLIYALTLSTWTVYSVARWQRFVIAGTGLDAFIYLGAAGWTSPQQVDQQLEQTTDDSNVNDHPYLQGAASMIGADPLGWVKHRVEELASAYLQPHGTTFFPGASLKEIAVKWLRQDRSLGGLIALTRGDAFWPKLALYVFHAGGLIFGLIGMWIYRRRWQVALVLIGFIVYVTLVHLLVLALPRYLFPNEVFWWIFAAAALQSIFDQLTRRRVLAAKPIKQGSS